MMMGGRTLISSDSAVPMRSFPVRLPGSRVISSACRTASSTASAQGSSLLPAWVSLMRLPIRSNSWVFSSASNCLICMVTADWE